MSRISERLAEIVTLAKDKKVTNYKKAIKSLLEFWEDNSDNESLMHLARLSQSQSQESNSMNDMYSWSDIYTIVHELFMNEIVRVKKLSGNYGNLDKDRILKLLYVTIKQTINWLKPKNIIISTLQILQIENAEYYSEFYEVYTSNLRKYVLQKRSKRILIKHSHWQELLRAFIPILENVIPKVDYAKLLETLELIIRYGCSLSTLLFETRKLLPIIGKIMENYESYDIKSTDVLFKLTFTVCQQIATDSRFILCKFSENMPLSMIDQKGPEEKYKLYLLLIYAHHPNGALLDDDVSFSYNNDKWKAILNLLYKMILNDIKPTSLSKSFVELACEVFRQRILTNLPSMSQSTTLHDSLFIQARKKRRISNDQEKIVDLVSDNDPNRAWPMIQIASTMYKKYPDCLKIDEYIEFLDVVIKLMSQAFKNFSIMESLCNLATVFVQNEQVYGNNDLKSYWDKIWDAVLRFLSMSHREYVQKGFILVQNLVSYKKVSNPNSLLKLYSTKTVQWSNFSIQTLKIFCENNILPIEASECDMNSTIMTNNSIKLQLLQWCLDALNKRLPSSLPIPEFSKILIGFTLKSWYKSHEHITVNDNNYFKELKNNFYDNMNAITLEDIERCYLSLQLKIDLFNNQNDIENEKLSKDKSVDIPYVTEDLEFLINSLIQFVQMEKADEDLSSFITKTALIAKVTSDLKAMKMIQCGFDEFCLVEELKTCLGKIFKKINKMNWSKSFRCTEDVTKALISLYQIQTDVLINDIILMSTSFESLKQIYEVCKIKSFEPELDLIIAQCKLNAVIVMALYCCINAGNEISEEQLKIVCTVLKLKKYDLNLESDVVCVLTILEIFANISDNLLKEELIEVLMSFIMELFQEWQNDDKVNRILLQLLPKFVNKLWFLKDTNNVHNALLICKLYHDQFANGVFGQLTHLSLVKSLNKIVRHDAFRNTDVEVLNHDVFMTFITSPYYLIRLESLNYIYSIFSLNEIEYSWKTDFFNKLEEAAQSIFLVQRELSPAEAQEEQLLRSTSAIQMLVTVICSKSIFQNPALYTLLQIVVDKNIDLSIVNKALQSVDKITSSSTRILEENLNYLLTSWCQVRSLDTFPHILLNCFSDAEFYQRYINDIFPVLIRGGKTREARTICENIGASFEHVFKVCCSSIIPWILSDEAALEKLQANDGEFEGIGNISSLIRESLQQIMIGIVQRLHDLNHFYRTFEMTVSLPKSDPPHFKSETVDLCFDRLIAIVSKDTRHSVFYIVITRQPSTIQRILLQLTRNIYSAKISEYRAKAIHQYVYFCARITEELKQKHCDLVATYFVKDIGCTLLHLVKDKDSFVASLACKYFQAFLTSLLPTRSAQVGNILDLCVKTLAPLVKSTNESSTAKEVLDFLIKEQRECLSGAIENLGSLPSILRSEDDIESQILRENLQHFLKSSDDKSCSIDGLLNIKRQLISNKSQLEKLYEELESIQGFTEQCATSVLHQLVYRLICLTAVNDEKIALEAAKCLGILGPADLTTMILHPQESQSRELLDKADVLTRKVCRMLADLVVSDEIELRTVSTDALYAVLESPWGSRLDLNCVNENEELEEFFMEFVYPFRSTQKTKAPSRTNVHIEISEFNPVFEQENPLWTEESKGSYDTWIANITSAVANCLSSFYSKSLVPVFKLNIQFCEMTLPHLISLIVDTNSNLAKKVCHCVNQFFNYHFCYDGDETLCAAPQKQQNMARDAIRCMLNVVNHLRIQTREHIHLDFNYLTIAMAAQLCSAYFSSVLYAELWCQANLEVARYFDSIPIIDQIYEQNNMKGKIVQDILKEAYMKIGDLDSIHGCGSSHLQNRRSKIPYYTNFQKLDKLILSHDVELSVGNYSIRGMVNTLRESSLHYLAKRLLSATPMQVDSTEDLCYDSLWRLSDWSQITSWKTSESSKKINNFSTCHYAALKSLNDNDNSSLENYLKEAYFCVIKDLCNISLESCEAVYPKLSQLQMLREIEELSTAKSDDYGALLKNWESEKYIFNNKFQYIEPILSQRAVMFNIREPIKSNSSIKSALINIQFETSRLAQQQGHFNVAARALETLAKQMDLDEETENRLVYHEAKLSWMRKDEDMARFNLRSLIKKDSVKPSLLARALRIYGNWIAENKSENPQVIITKYYNKAIATYTSMSELSSEDLKDGCRARAALAQFAHEQYLMITEYLKSPQFESLKECINYSRNAVPKNVKVTDKDLYQVVRANTKQSTNDFAELENIQKDKDSYLSIAIVNYLLTLQDSDDHDFLIFRLISLWLDNMYDGEVNKILEKHLGKVPSYKFIPLVPQLAPHMNNILDEFTSKINQVLECCAKEHPHHTLPVLLALKNLYNDSKYCGKKVTKQEPRVLGAQVLIQKLLSTEIRPIIQEMDKLSDALVMLAYYDSEKKKAAVAKSIPIPRNVGLSDIKDFQHSIVPTLTIDVKKNGNYSNIVSVKKYETSYGNVGGINAPKKIICIGSDGIQRAQLVKGRDDLRQDAVMQQVFTVMNSLLRSNKDSKQRRLHIRTYKVVPLTQRSGILQWCENTLPIGIILTGDGNRDPGLHRKYYPNDYNPGDCRRRMQATKTNDQKYNVFMDCCKNLRPAFHHFFTENYLSPETWFERRLAYTRSVATTSIIGYILGLGDRHVSNILIDTSTAEVIHIDFGIAFEQGKVLPTPELVPFRLTRDIEVAMGVSGVEGTMRRCCEETMTVLREKKEVIVTLLRVLLYDPLYSWAITPAQAATYQSEHSSRSSDNQSNSPVGNIETNKLAERALLRVQQKLQGIEEGVASSIEGQVERLIQQARDPRNLSKLFQGWQAYL